MEFTVWRNWERL